MRYSDIRYVPEEDDRSLTIETENLVARIIDNTGLLASPVESPSYFNTSHRFMPFTHHLGYHGIRTLYDKTERRNVVVPFVSWLNLQGAELSGIEHDEVDERAWAGRGRGWPVTMQPKGNGVLLSLEPMPSMQMRYSLELQPAEPDGIDFSIRFVFNRKPEAGPARFHATWPCYISAYDDVRLFYPQGPSPDDWQWASIGKKPDIIIGEPVHYNHSQEGFYAENQALPLGYGRIGNRVLILMFSDPSVRFFTVNAGGHFFCSPVQNPAWDFEWVAEDYPVGKEIGFDGRIVYTRSENADCVVEQYRKWVNECRV